MNSSATGEARAGSDSGGSTSTSLLARLKAQDSDAWQRLVQVYTPLVYSWCRRFGVGPEDAADILQEVFRAVHGAIDRFDHDRPRANFRGWLWTVTRNKTNDHFRAAGNRPRAVGGTDAQLRLQQMPDCEPETDDYSDGSSGDHAVFLRGLETVRADFEDRTWQAFWRVTVDGETTADVAADLGVTVNAVRKAKSRVLRRLRDELDGLM